MTEKTLTTANEALLAEFFNEVENRISANSTLILRKEFCIYCSVHNIPSADRDKLAESLIYNKNANFSKKVEDKISEMLDLQSVQLNIDSIKTAVKEKEIIDKLREQVKSETDVADIRICLLNRLKENIDILATSNSPFILNKIQNLIDETTRLDFERWVATNVVHEKIVNDPLLNPDINEQAREILKYIQ